MYVAQIIYLLHVCYTMQLCSFLSSASDGKYVVLGTRLRPIFGRRSFTVAGPSIWNSLPPMSAILTLRLSFVLNSKLTSSPLSLDSNDFPASISTSELSFFHSFIPAI